MKREIGAGALYLAGFGVALLVLLVSAP